MQSPIMPKSEPMRSATVLWQFNRHINSPPRFGSGPGATGFASAAASFWKNTGRASGTRARVCDPARAMTEGLRLSADCETCGQAGDTGRRPCRNKGGRSGRHVGPMFDWSMFTSNSLAVVWQNAREFPSESGIQTIGKNAPCQDWCQAYPIKTPCFPALLAKYSLHR